MDIFNQPRSNAGKKQGGVSDKFGPDQIQLGKTSTKRATNLSSLNDNSSLDKIFEQ